MLKSRGVNPLVYDRNSITISFQNGNIIVSGTDNKCTLKLFDLSGRNITSATVDNGICPLPSLSNGIYLVTVTDGASSKTQKVAIK
ncbi:T9SS type A sorting domain-containing protein [uncultured Bacteroides sp.]|uniref:T9SS type A sorting domain-containing protein n=1 Tax=uncultured Bacteroides sp. TaxID=162156 RepID=UPI00338FA6CF